MRLIQRREGHSHAGDARVHPKSPLFASLSLSHSTELTVPPDILRRFSFATQQILFCNLFRLFWKLFAFFSLLQASFAGSILVSRIPSTFSRAEFSFHNALQRFPIVFNLFFFFY